MIADSTLDPKAEFWRAFAEIEPELVSAIRGADRDRLNAQVEYLFARLGNIDSRLCPEIGRGKDDMLELCISPDGHLDAIDAARKVVAAAPQFANWRVFACKERMDIHDIEVVIGEDKISCHTIRYVADFGSLPLDLTLYFNVGEDVPVDHLYGVSAIFLDRALGEFESITGIRTLNVRVGRPPTARPLAEFAKAFDMAKAKIEIRH